MLTPLPSGYGPWSRAFHPRASSQTTTRVEKPRTRRWLLPTPPVRMASTPRIAFTERPTLLDFCFLELDVLPHDGIVLLEDKLLRRRSRVLLCHVKEAGPGRRQQLDLLSDRLGHEGNTQHLLRLSWPQHTHSTGTVKATMNHAVDAVTCVGKRHIKPA